jgi:long-chain acyl-CoA synthetase
MLLEQLQRNAEYHPHDTALVFKDESVSHRDLLDRVERCAQGLLELGVKPGDRVALLLENSPDFITGFFAVAACRGANVPLNLEFKEDEISFFLDDAGVSVLIVDSQRVELAQRAAAASSTTITIVVAGDDRPGCKSFSSLLECEGTAPLPSPSLDDDVIFLYSSGSTGRPKCAPRTLLQYWWEMDDVIEGLHLTRADVIFCAIPLFHNFGAVHCMLAAAGSGAKLVILNKLTPFVLRRSQALKLLESERVTIFPCVPFNLGHLADATTQADLSSVRICYSGAAVLTEAVADAFFEKFEVKIRQHYGCTEVGAMTINLDADPWTFRESVGSAFPGVTIRILDEDGNELPVGSMGEVVVSSRQMTSGYLGEDDVNRELFRDGCFYTGDLGRLDDEGRLYLMGRKKFVIDVVGQKVSPIEVEDVLNQHPAISESVAIGVPNPAGAAQIVQAYVVAVSDCTSEVLTDFCRDRLANFKIPHKIEFISEVPKNAMGKVQRKKELLEAKIVSLQDAERCEAQA